MKLFVCVYVKDLDLSVAVSCCNKLILISELCSHKLRSVAVNLLYGNFSLLVDFLNDSA